MLERDLPSSSRLPENLTVQLDSVPPSMEERIAIAAELQEQIFQLLTSNQIEVLGRLFRAKTDQGIAEKLGRRPVSYRYTRPLPDIYAARFILRKSDIYTAASLISQRYSVPEEYPWGLPGIVDHNQMDETEKARFSHSLPEYKAVHIHIPFGDREIYNIGEVQLLTPEQLRIANGNRIDFERREGRRQAN